MTGLERLLTYPRFGTLGAPARMARWITPLRATPTIKIVGTNGKGTTAAILGHLAVGADLTVGVYTSPHIHRINERISLNGEDISDADLEIALHWACDQIDDHPDAGRFEVLTLAALWFFNQHDLDLIILEAGLGGRHDPIQAAWGEVAVLTSVDFDHTDILGPTLDHITREKAAICKAGDTLYSGIGPLGPLAPKGVTVVDLATPHAPLMVLNERLAQAALSHVFPNRTFPTLDRDFQVKGRCEQVAQAPNIYVDVAHTPQAIERTIQRFDACPNLHILWYARADKDHTALEAVIQPFQDRHTVTACTAPDDALRHIQQTTDTNRTFLCLGGFDIVETVKRAYDPPPHGAVIRL